MKMKIFNPCNERVLSSFLEYSVLAMAVLLATVSFYLGNFTGIQANIAGQFQNMVRQVVP